MIADEWPDNAIQCRQCQTPLHNYGELTLVDDSSGLSGRPDLILKRNGRYRIVEIKSMNGPEYDTLQGPIAQHVEQAACYRRLMELASFPMEDDVTIIYVTKQFVYGSPYREFSVNTGPGTHWHDAVDMYREQARAVRSNSLLPRLPLCSDPHAPRSRECPTCAECFARSA